MNLPLGLELMIIQHQEPFRILSIHNTMSVFPPLRYAIMATERKMGKSPYLKRIYISLIVLSSIILIGTKEQLDTLEQLAG